MGSVGDKEQCLNTLSASELSVPFISLSTAQDREAQLSAGRRSCPQPKSNSGREISLTACLG